MGMLHADDHDGYDYYLEGKREEFEAWCESASDEELREYYDRRARQEARDRVERELARIKRDVQKEATPARLLEALRTGVV